ncbi:MAG TPA: hypothetical protein VMV45_06985, partial [Casimicrobiaceae bacterium]|nr:hypothetical protein [Casimicrobiaceae bacterium]
MPLAAMACGLPVPLLVTVIVALRAPVAVGANDTEIVHCAPGATLLHVVVTGNSDGFELVTLLTATAVPPVLVTVMTLAALEVPTFWVPKVAVCGNESWPGVALGEPVPDTAIVCGLPAPLLVMVMVPLRAPVAAGVNVIEIVHVALALSVVQPELDTPNSEGALLAMPEMATALPPVLVTVTLCAALVVPTVCVPKLTLAWNDNCPGGAPGVPVPLTLIVCGLPAPLLAMVMVAVRGPVAAGLNVTLTVQLAAGLSDEQFDVSGNSVVLSLATLLTVTVPLPLLVMVTTDGALVVPTLWSPKMSEDGTPRSVRPVPRAWTANVTPPLPLKLRLADRAPPATGLNATANEHELPLASVDAHVLLLTGNSPELLFANTRPVASA